MKLFVCLLLTLLVSACASLGPQPAAVVPHDSKPVVASQNDHEKGWWYVNFFITWPEDSDIDWSVDTYLAHAVVEPVLRQYRINIELWRFHRRALRDKAGHQFSFIFYSTPAVADAINQALQNETQLQALINKGVLLRVGYDNPQHINRPNIQDTSDKSWSLPLQKTWPYFIMGASETWLRLADELIQRQRQNSADEPSDLNETLTFYQGIEKQLDAIWRNEGAHAFLHHVSGLFAYQETLVIERRLVNF